MNEKYITISAMTRYLKSKFDLDENLKSVFLKGEISNFKAHTSGHLYFSLKDESSKINAVMFNYARILTNYTPKDGDSVLVHGRIGVYEVGGSYQIYVDDMSLDGVGNLYVLFEELKKKHLEYNQLSLFDEQLSRTKLLKKNKIEEVFDNYWKWYDDSVKAENHPLIKVVAVLMEV